jgi:hypothetical protein
MINITVLKKSTNHSKDTKSYFLIGCIIFCKRVQLIAMKKPHFAKQSKSSEP